MSQIYQLASPDLKIPMPDRSGRLFSPEGEAVDPTIPFYAMLINGGDIIPAADNAASRKKG